MSTQDHPDWDEHKRRMPDPMAIHRRGRPPFPRAITFRFRFFIAALGVFAAFNTFARACSDSIRPQSPIPLNRAIKSGCATDIYFQSDSSTHFDKKKIYADRDLDPRWISEINNSNGFSGILRLGDVNDCSVSKFGWVYADLTRYGSDDYSACRKFATGSRSTVGRPYVVHGTTPEPGDNVFCQKPAMLGAQVVASSTDSNPAAIPVIEGSPISLQAISVNQ